jgi:glycosyltransferase involved in cell wall biosynthesis
MAAGVPVVATSVGGVPDVVTPAEAVLVPPEDPDALAAGARAVLAEPAQARSRADAAARKLESEFAPTPWLKRYTEVYAEAVEVARARHWLAN